MTGFSVQPYDHDHENEVTVFAKSNFRNQERKFGIRTDDRRKHIYIIGKTGMGKTTLIENFVLSDIHAGHGLCYIDPHGDTAQTMLDYIPASRINDVVYFNPSDVDHPIGFNIFEVKDDRQKHLIASGLMGVFKKIWPDVWSPRMEYILMNTILALLDAPGSSLLGITRILVDDEYRRRVISLIQDPVVKTFWVKEFMSWQDKYRTEAIAPVQNKVGQFLSSRIIRNVVAQVKSTIDLRDIMDTRKILLVNLSKGMVGEENMRLLGGMLITKLQMTVMERVDTPEKDRQDFYLYVDEFQNFANESFASILSEARKYRLNLMVAHQYIEQMDEVTRAAIFGNVGSIITFRVGAADATFMEQEFMPTFTPEDLVNLRKHDIYLKLMIDGAASEPFSASTLPPVADSTGSTEKVIRVSRERYSRPKATIEDKVVRWSGLAPGEDKENDAENDILSAAKEIGVGLEELKRLQDSSPKVKEPPVSESKKKKDAKFEIPCSVCGEMQHLTFEPDWTKPWFCKNHLDMRGKPLPVKVLPKPAPTSVENQPSASVTPVVSESRPAARPSGGNRSARTGGGRGPRRDVRPMVKVQPRPSAARDADTSNAKADESGASEPEGLSLSALKPSGSDTNVSRETKRPEDDGRMKASGPSDVGSSSVQKGRPAGQAPAAELKKPDPDRDDSSAGPKPLDPGQTVKF
ncbi:MAG: type IV secretion system DNA-binding domain-containing protein [bacterium]